MLVNKVHKMYIMNSWSIRWKTLAKRELHEYLQSNLSNTQSISYDVHCQDAFVHHPYRRTWRWVHSHHVWKWLYLLTLLILQQELTFVGKILLSLNWHSKNPTACSWFEYAHSHWIVEQSPCSPWYHILMTSWSPSSLDSQDFESSLVHHSIKSHLSSHINVLHSA